jgi:hypothetical protein
VYFADELVQRKWLEKYTSKDICKVIHFVNRKKILSWGFWVFKRCRYFMVSNALGIPVCPKFSWTTLRPWRLAREWALKYTTYNKKNWISHTLHRNCLLKHIIEGKIAVRIEVKEMQGRRHKQLLCNFKETRGYWKLKEEELDRTLLKTRFGRGYGPAVRQTAV